MRTISIILILSLSSICLVAQNVVNSNTVVPVKQSKYKLFNDAPAFNKRYSLWIPAAEVIGINAFIFTMDRYVFKYSYSTSVSVETWKHNIDTGWVWDTDRFGINFIGHPYSGSLTFNAARSTGYNFWQSVPFAFAGSVMWEYFGENTAPSYNDLINTTVNGAFLGEILYRISSNILDDRTRGSERVFREIAAGIVDPIRGLNRLIQGKSFRKTNEEVYQKEPLNIAFYAGAQKLNKDPDQITTSGIYNAILNLQFDYGDPFEDRFRKPFDFFKLRIDLCYGSGRKILDNVRGYGILVGKNYQPESGKTAWLVGAFQHYDYWDNWTFELGTIGLGGGVINNLTVHEASKSYLYTTVHIAGVPFAGVSTRFGPNDSQVRDYNFGAGLEGKFESTINWGRWATASLGFYYYWIHSYVGLPEESFISIIKPRVTVTIYKNLCAGLEPALYYDDVYTPDQPAVHLSRAEWKAFLLFKFQTN